MIGRLPAAAFIVAAAYVPPQLLFSGAYMPHWWTMALLLPLVSSLDPRSIDRRIGVCIAVGLSWAVLSLLWTAIPAEGTMDLIFLVLLSLAMLAGASAQADEVDRTIAAFGWGVALSAPVCIAQALGYAIGPSTYHPAGLFFNSEIMGLTAAPIVVWAARSRRLFLCLATLIPLVLCDSRVAIIAAGIAFLYAYFPAHLRVRYVAAIVVGAALFLIIVWAAAPNLVRTSTALSRVVLWGAGIENMSVRGNGIGWWPVAFPGPLEEYAHSDVLQLLVELGVGASFLFAVPIIILMRKECGDVADRAAFVCLCIEACISFPSHLPATGFLAAVLAGGMVRRRSSAGERQPVLGDQHADDVRWATAHGARVVRSIALGASHFPI